jgi:hypothetical protein
MFLVGFVLLIFVVFCVVFFVLLVFVLYLVSNVARVSGLSIVARVSGLSNVARVSGLSNVARISGLSILLCSLFVLLVFVLYLVSNVARVSGLSIFLYSLLLFLTCISPIVNYKRISYFEWSMNDPALSMLELANSFFHSDYNFKYLSLNLANEISFVYNENRRTAYHDNMSKQCHADLILSPCIDQQ